MKKRMRYLSSVVIITSFVVVALGSKDEKEEETKSKQNKELVKTDEWEEVYRFKGNGMKKSPVFKLNGNEARIKYKYQSTDGVSMGMFAAFVVDEGLDIMKDGGIPEVMTQSESEESETSIQKNAGNYYLNVNASGNWTVIVEQVK